MAYKKAGDGRVIQRGRTNVDVMPTDGEKVIDSRKATAGKGLNASYRAVGRNMARANNQKKG